MIVWKKCKCVKKNMNEKNKNPDKHEQFENPDKHEQSENPDKHEQFENPDKHDESEIPDKHDESKIPDKHDESNFQKNTRRWMYVWSSHLWRDSFLRYDMRWLDMKMKWKMSEIKNEKSTTEKEVHNKIARNCSEPKPIISISFCKLCPILEFSMTLNNINVAFLQQSASCPIEQ